MVYVGRERTIAGYRRPYGMETTSDRCSREPSPRMASTAPRTSAGVSWLGDRLTLWLLIRSIASRGPSLATASSHLQKSDSACWCDSTRTAQRPAGWAFPVDLRCVDARRRLILSARDHLRVEASIRTRFGRGRFAIAFQVHRILRGRSLYGMQV